MDPLKESWGLLGVLRVDFGNQQIRLWIVLVNYTT